MSDPFVNAFVADHVAAHVAALGPARVGMGYAPLDAVRPQWGAWLVPPDMWDGEPDAHGRVRWKHLHTPVLPLPISFGQKLPAEFKAYLNHHRVGFFPAQDGDRTWLLPPTPTHDPLFHYRACKDRWVFLAFAGDAPVLAESLDGEWLACPDPTAADPTAAPVLELRAEDVFRLEPELATADAGACKSEVRRRGRVISPSFREMLTATRADRQPVPPHVVFPPPRRGEMIPPFDWGPLLPPEVPPDEQAPVESADADRHLPDLGEHLDRIARKLALLRDRDPAYLTWGSEYHRYRHNPPLLPDERARFEAAEGCRLPEAYAAYLTRIGNGGRGPWRWMDRVEVSGAAWLTRWRLGNGGVDADRLARPFPHRRHWNPKPPGPRSKRLAEYHDNRRIDGTVIIGEAADASLVRANVLLVATGPERGHVWSDLRNYGKGIKPVFRRGPLSFLAWLEDGIDRELGKTDALYDAVVALLRRPDKRPG